MTALQLEYRKVKEQERANKFKEAREMAELQETRFKNREMLSLEKARTVMQGVNLLTQSLGNIANPVVSATTKLLPLI